MVEEAVYKDSEKQFLSDLNAQLAKQPKGQRKLLIFVMAINTMFSEALYRLTQIADDANNQAVPVLFSWPRAGRRRTMSMTTTAPPPPATPWSRP